MLIGSGKTTAVAIFTPTFKSTVELLANDNDDEAEEEDAQLDNILARDFKKLTEKGKDKESILERIPPRNYKIINFAIDDSFLKNTFLGFSYLVPQTDDQQVQQKYYSSVFRNINIQGEALLPQESRPSSVFWRGIQMTNNCFFLCWPLNKYFL